MAATITKRSVHVGYRHCFLCLGGGWGVVLWWIGGLVAGNDKSLQFLQQMSGYFVVS